MQVTLTPQAEELLRAELARHPDQSPAQIVEIALADRVEHETAVRDQLPEPKRLSPEQFQMALDRMAQFSRKIPALPMSAFSRESFYKDHD